MDLGIQGNVALITGGASGIGLATARLFAEEGCAIRLWDRSENVTSVAQQLQQDGFDAEGQVVDIVQLDNLQSGFDQLLTKTPRVDHIVHCAAIGSGHFGFPFTDLKPGDWQKTIEVNIQGTTNVAHVLAPHLASNRNGTFIMLASVAGQIGSQTDPPYRASKAANINFAQCMAKDLASYGVRVNTVCPGMVKTPLNRSVWQAWYDKADPAERVEYEAWAAAKIKQVVPLGRWQDVHDIASMIVFLSSERAKEVTGQTINVDGGFVMHW